MDVLTLVPVEHALPNLKKEKKKGAGGKLEWEKISESQCCIFEVKIVLPFWMLFPLCRPAETLTVVQWNGYYQNYGLMSSDLVDG